MTINGIKQIFQNVATQKGYQLEERPSLSTNSYYFKLLGASSSILFRVSDHATRDNVVTLRIDKKLNVDRVRGFILNRCADLSVRQRDRYFAQL